MKLKDLIKLNPKLILKKGVLAPFVEMAALPTNEKFIHEIGQRKVIESGAKFQNGDTLFARITPCLENGKGGYVSGLPDEVVGQGSTEFIVLRARKKSDEQFAYYLSRFQKFRSFAEKGMEGTSGRQRVTWQTLADFELPDLSEMQRAALGEVLGSLDDKIELNRRMNETLEEMARALFRDWFIDFGPTRRQMDGATDPAAIMGHAFPNAKAAALAPLFPAKLGEDGLPEGWENHPLSSVVQQQKQVVKPDQHVNEIFEHFSLPAFDKAKWPTLECGAEIKSNKTAIPSNAILVSKLNPRIERIWIPKDVGNHRQICSTEFLCFKPINGFGLATVEALLRSDGMHEKMASMVTGTSNSHQRVPPKVLMQAEVLLPANIARLFENVTLSFLEKRQVNQKENQTLSEIRDLLLPKLMSGEIQLKDAPMV